MIEYRNKAELLLLADFFCLFVLFSLFLQSYCVFSQFFFFTTRADFQINLTDAAEISNKIKFLQVVLESVFKQKREGI